MFKVIMSALFVIVLLLALFLFIGRNDNGELKLTFRGDGLMLKGSERLIICVVVLFLLFFLVSKLLDLNPAGLALL
jgi:hypothetical protein